MQASDYFARARDAAISLDGMRASLEYARSAEQPCGVDYLGVTVRTSGDDRSAATIRRIMLEQRYAERQCEYEAIMDAALERLYGEDGRGGLAKRHGGKYADAICLRYLQLASCRESSEAMGYTPDYITRLCTEGFRLMDEDRAEQTR